MAMRPNDTGIALLAGGLLLGVVGAAIMAHSFLFLIPGLILVLIFVRMIV